MMFCSTQAMDRANQGLKSQPWMKINLSTF
jgi:hypothetical protein